MALLTAPQAAHAYSMLYAFGDSLSDAGNIYAATGNTIPAPPYSNGRFTNGAVWVQDLAQALHMAPVTPSALGGTDHAWGLATTGYAPTANTTPPASLIPTVQAQVVGFLAGNGGSAPSSALYTVWGGANDLFNIIDNFSNLPAAIANAQGAAQFEANTIGSLIAAGATNVLVPLIPDLSTTPAYNSSPAAQALSRLLSLSYNSALLDNLAGVSATPGVNLNILDTFSAINAIVADPGAYGLTEVTQQCYPSPPGDYTAGGPSCANPNDYLYWDWVHPTAAGHALVADAAFALVPEPASFAVFAAGLGSMLLVGRRNGRERKAQKAA